jgi:uncharacterized membrane protein YphA (DoxX/SURF4 family)
MNGLIWIGQVALACVFLTLGTFKLLASRPLLQAVESRMNIHLGMPPMRARIMAFGVLLPDIYTPDGMVPEFVIARCCAAGLALLMVGTAIYHARRKEHAALDVAFFLLALFVIVGRWPY